MTAIKARGETPFSEAGDGVVLCFTNADLKRIQENPKYGKHFMPTLTDEMMSGAIDIEILEDLAQIGAKKDRKPLKLGPEVFDRIIVADLAQKVLDGLYGAVHGKTFQEYIEATAKVFEEARERGAIPPQFRPDTITSMTSENAPTGQESALKSSGE